MYLNDAIGDCTCADVGHAEQLFSHFGAGTTVTVTENDVLAVYKTVGGYVPGDPSTDNGCVIQDVLTYWRKRGVAGHKILAFFQVNHRDTTELKACCWLFGGVTLGVNLPKSAMQQFNAGQPWDYKRFSSNKILGGHDIRLVGYDGEWWYVVTWGAVQKVTTAWLMKFVEEAWSEADDEWIKLSTAPNGISKSALNAAFEQVTGQTGPFIVSGNDPVPQPLPSVEQPSEASLWEIIRNIINMFRFWG
jgi:hypothetical protein